MNNTFKVGIMTLATTALLIFLVFKIGDLSFSEKGYHFTISYYNCSGLSKGSGVSMSGYRIGKVTGIELSDDMVYVHCYIQDKNFHIRRNSVFTIMGEGLMGDKHVEIVPTRDFTSPYVANNEIVAGTTPTSLDQLVDQGNVLLQRLQELTASAKEIVGDPELKDNARTIFRNARNATDNINEVTLSVRNKADHIIDNLDKILNSVHEEVEKNRADLKKMIENFRKISEEVEDVAGGSKKNVKEMIAHLKSATEKLDSMIAKLNADNKLTNDVRATVDSLKKASANVKDITAEVKGIVVDKNIKKKINTALEDAHKLANAVDKVFMNIKSIRIDFKYMLRYNRDSEKYYSDFNVDIYPNKTYYINLGVEDIGGKNKFYAQYARDADTKFIKRAGIIYGKVGLGLDYMIFPQLKLTAEAIDTKDTEVRFKARYAVHKNVAFELRMDKPYKADKRYNFGLEYVF